MADVCLCVPVLNEMQNIGTLVAGITQAMKGRDYVLLFVDDGSRDGTVEFIRRAMASDARVKLIERVKTRLGCQRGGALFDGMVWALKHTACSVFVEMDGDLSHRPEELHLGIEALAAGADFVIASKYLDGAETVRRPVSRRAISAICNVAVRTLIDRSVTDYSNGYRFYTRAVAETIARHDIRYTSPIYLTECLAICLKHGFRVREFPSIYIGRNEGLSKLRPIDLIKGSLAIFAIAFQYHVTGFADRAADAVES